MGCLCVVCKQCVYARKKSVIKNSLKRYSKQLNESKTKKYRKKSVFEWHINFFVKKWYKTIAKKTKKEYCICTDNYGGIAQLVRALASHARGRRFESYCLYHLITNVLIQLKGVKISDICPRNRAFFNFWRFASRWKLVRTEEFLKISSTRKMKAH